MIIVVIFYSLILIYSMWRLVLGTIFGIYLAQTYKLPNIKQRFLELDKYLKDNQIIDKIDKDDE